MPGSGNMGNPGRRSFTGTNSFQEQGPESSNKSPGGEYSEDKRHRRGCCRLAARCPVTVTFGRDVGAETSFRGAGTARTRA